MFEVVYMKADFEPWWMFEGWEEAIVSKRLFAEVTDAKMYLEDILTELRQAYCHERVKKKCFFAFWSESEKSFCEGCDEDLQIYHGVMLLFDGKPFTLEI